MSERAESDATRGDEAPSVADAIRSISFKRPESADRPKAAAAYAFTTVLVYTIFANKYSSFFWNVFVEVVFLIVATGPVRQGHGVLFQTLVVMVGVVASYPLGKASLAVIRSDWYFRIFFGKPVFADLKGPSRRLFDFILCCCAQVTMTLDPDTEFMVDRMGRRNIAAAEQIYLYRYERAGYPLDEWPRVWQEMQEVTRHGRTFGAAVSSLRWDLFAGRISNLANLVAPLFLIYTGGVIWLLPGTLQSRNPLALLQFALLGGFALSFYIISGFTSSLAAVRFFGVGGLKFLSAWFDLGEDPAGQAALQWLETEYRQVDPSLAADIEVRKDRPSYPRITFGPGLSRALHGYFLRTLLAYVVLNMATFLAMLLASYPLALLFSPSTSAQLDTWYERMVLGTLLGPLAFLVLLAAAFYALESFMLVFTFLLTAALATVIPLVAAHWAKVRITAEDFSSSVAAGVSAALVLVIAEVVRRRSGSEKTATG